MARVPPYSEIALDILFVPSNMQSAGPACTQATGCGAPRPITLIKTIFATVTVSVPSTRILPITCLPTSTTTVTTTVYVTPSYSLINGPRQTNRPDNEGAPAVYQPAMIGGLFAGIVVFTIGLFLAYVLQRRRRRKRQNTTVYPFRSTRHEETPLPLKGPPGIWRRHSGSFFFRIRRRIESLLGHQPTEVRSLVNLMDLVLYRSAALEARHQERDPEAHRYDPVAPPEYSSVYRVST